jgi:exodeoxyribonuclease-3
MTKIKVATWNVNSIRIRMPHLEQWINQHSPDILAIQETKIQDPEFPQTYNGVAIASLEKATDILIQLPNFPDGQRRFLAGTIGNIRVINVYVPNGEAVGSEKFEYKLEWLKSLRAHLIVELLQYEKLLVLGDFNIAPTDEDVYDPLAWRNRVLVSEGERAAFQSLLNLGLNDSFRLFPQEKNEYSWWDYRMGAYRRNHGLRIDHVLVSNKLKMCCRSSLIDKSPRGWEKPSDHAPVFAEFDFS